MRQQILCGLIATALLLGAASAIVYPLPAAAQQPQDPTLFTQRMSARIDAVQMRIKNLANDLSGETGVDGRSSPYDPDSGMLRRLENLDEECRKLERELDTSGVRSMGFPSQVYQQQREIEYYVWGLEQQVQQIRRWIHAEDQESETPVEEKPGPDTEEDGISDEDWAADWAKGD